MRDILQHINGVEGVIGSAVFSERGTVLAHALPPLVDVSSLKKVAGLVMECAQGLQVTHTLELLDMRYSDGRVIVKNFAGSSLFLLCTKNVSIQVLSISLNLAAKKLANLIPAAGEIEENQVSESATTSVGGTTVQPAEGVLQLNVSHLANKQASASFDSLGMIAISQPTFSYISDFYKQSFKKLTLINAVSGARGTFPVMVMKDMDQQYDGTIVVGPGIEKKLKVSEGDKVEVHIGG